MGNDTLNRRQMLALAFVALLSPVARRFPSSLVAVSGSAAWLAAPLAAVPILIMIFFMKSLLRHGRSLGEVFELSLGRWAGRAAVVIVSLWLCFYGGFILRSAAYRFTSTVYPSAGAWIFVIFSAAVCLPIAMGKLSSIARMAVLFRPLLLGALALVFTFALADGDFRGVFTFKESDSIPLLKSGFTVVNTLSVVCFLGFGENRCGEAFKSSRYILWAMVLLTITELLCLSCLGIFGAELTSKLNYPFFMLVRDINIFNSFARMEAFALALWMFADAVHFSLLLWLASRNFSRCLNAGSSICAIASAAISAAVGLALPSDMLGVGLFSEKIVPFGNALIIFGLLPFVFLLGRARKKI